MRFHAIAQMQGVSLNTVQGRFRYGVDKLKTLLDGKISLWKQTENLSRKSSAKCAEPASSKLDERVHREMDDAAKETSAAPLTLGQMLASILGQQSIRYTVATHVGAGISGGAGFDSFDPRSAWAMDQAVEAIKKYRGLQMSGDFTKDGKTFRSNSGSELRRPQQFCRGRFGKSGE